MTRPSEGVTAAIGSIVGAVLIILGATTHAQISPEVAGAIITLVSWIATAVTWYVANKQRAGEATSAADGTVR